jgi:MFS family permease
VLAESRDPNASRLPDLLGAAMIIAAVGSLTLAIVKGPDWGWGSAQVVGLFAAAIVLVPAFLVRSARHPAPVIEVEMLRVRSFALANLAGVFFFAAFGAMLLAGVLWLTQVWHYSVLTAGLALVPGPAMAAIFAAPSGRLADRFGQRAVGIPGALLFAASFGWLQWQVGLEPAYVSEYLPGLILGGIGVGLTIPSISSAAAASLPPARFATGSAVVGMARQIGAALGVAILIAVLGTPSGAGVLDAFDRAWTLMALAAVVGAIAFAAMGRVRVAATVVAPAVEGAR